MLSILISGKIGSGKDTFAGQLHNALPHALFDQFNIVSLSYRLVDLVDNAFLYVRSSNATEIGFSKLVTDLASVGIVMTPRQQNSFAFLLQQQVRNGNIVQGCAINRQAYIDIGQGLKDVLDNRMVWAQLAHKQIALNGTVPIIPDIRDPAEIEYFGSIGDIITVRLETPERERIARCAARIKFNKMGEDIKPYLNHPTECALDQFKFDYVIINDRVLSTNLDSIAHDIVATKILPLYKPQNFANQKAFTA